MKYLIALVSILMIGCGGGSTSGGGGGSVPATVQSAADLLHPIDRAYVFENLIGFETYVSDGVMVLEDDWWGRTILNRAGGLVHEARHAEMDHVGCIRWQEIDANARAAIAMDRIGQYGEAHYWRNQGGVHCPE